MVDDDPAIRSVVERFLTVAGYRVVVAEDGFAGATRYREGGIDLVLLDIHMPGMDGIELLAQLRGDDSRLPIIMISGGDQTRSLNLLADARLLGANAVLEKPFAIAQLAQTIAGLLRRDADRHHSA